MPDEEIWTSFGRLERVTEDKMQNDTEARIPDWASGSPELWGGWRGVHAHP